MLNDTRRKLIIKINVRKIIKRKLRIKITTLKYVGFFRSQQYININ